MLAALWEQPLPQGTGSGFKEELIRFLGTLLDVPGIAPVVLATEVAGVALEKMQVRRLAA